MTLSWASIKQEKKFITENIEKLSNINISYLSNDTIKKMKKQVRNFGDLIHTHVLISRIYMVLL